MREGLWSLPFGEMKEEVVRGGSAAWGGREGEGSLGREEGSSARVPGPAPLPLGRPASVRRGVCPCVHIAHADYGLSSGSPWGRKTSGSANWGPRGFTLGRTSRMERQGILPELLEPQGLAPAEGSGWGDPSGPPLRVEEETAMQGCAEEPDLLPQG